MQNQYKVTVKAGFFLEDTKFKNFKDALLIDVSQSSDYIQFSLLLKVNVYCLPREVMELSP